MRLGFSGHQNLPPEAAALLQEQLQNFVRTNHPVVGVCSLAKGGDQLFARTIIEERGTLEVVIPSRGYESTFDEEGRHEYERLLELASKKTLLDFDSPSEKAYMDAGKYIVDHCDALLAAWDGRDSRGLGGTADVVAYARLVGLEVLVVWPTGVVR